MVDPGMLVPGAVDPGVVVWPGEVVWPAVCPEVDAGADPAVEGEPPAAVPRPALVPVCNAAVITPSWWNKREVEVGPGGVGFGFVLGAPLVHSSESLVALVTLNCLMLGALAELFVPGAELPEAWPGPVAVALLPEFIPAPPLFAELEEFVPVAEPSMPVT